jgi:hypothetical protein
LLVPYSVAVLVEIAVAVFVGVAVAVLVAVAVCVTVFVGVAVAVPVAVAVRVGVLVATGRCRARRGGSVRRRVRRVAVAVPSRWQLASLCGWLSQSRSEFSSPWRRRRLAPGGLDLKLAAMEGAVNVKLTQPRFSDQALPSKTPVARSIVTPAPATGVPPIAGRMSIQPTFSPQARPERFRCRR